MKIRDITSIAIALESKFVCNRSAYGLRQVIWINGDKKVKYRAIHEEVTLDTFKAHVQGQRVIMIYPFVPGQSVVQFAAVDLDNKPHKPQQAYFLKDAMAICKRLADLGIHCGLARSSGDGFHIYTFFSGPIEASIARDLLYKAIKEAGITSDGKARPMPEVFPKQETCVGLGNGIRPPMSIPGMLNERNCWLDPKSGETIPLESQLKHFTSIESNDPSFVESIIGKRHNGPINKAHSEEKKSPNVCGKWKTRTQFPTKLSHMKSSVFSLIPKMVAKLFVESQ